MELLINSKRHGKHIVFFDDDDVAKVLQYKWHVVNSISGFYAATAILLEGKKMRVEMHRLIMGSEPGKVVDHIDRNTLNNHRSNLRFCAHSQNRFNSRGKLNSRTGYKGVFTHRNCKNYRAQISIGGKQIHGGMFKTPEEAALRYNELAVQYFGEFAYLNEIPNQNTYGSRNKQPTGTN